MIRNKMLLIHWILILIFNMYFLAIPAIALEVETHRAINEYIADKSKSFNNFSLHQYLQKQLGMQNGSEENFNNKKVFKLIGDGGVYEDKPSTCIPYWRSRNHFHNPIDNSGFSGWWDTGIFEGISVIDWIIQPVNSQICGYYSWNDVRYYYHQALISTDKATRETNFAQTFRGLGQLMHLVQDMSVPDHVRNNGHYFAYNYEKWADDTDNRGPLAKYPVLYFVPDSSFPLKVENLFDTGQYNGTNPDITFNSNIGLSEYTSANFLSPHTIFNKPNIPYPAYAQTEYNKTIAGNLYLTKRGHGDGNGSGERIETLARAQNFHNYLSADYKILALTVKDPMVYKEYANKLIPRAIGYSSQVLSYFFRGTLEISLAENEGAYAVATTDAGFDQITLAVKNNSTAAEEMTDGEIYLVVKYKLALADPFQNEAVPVTEDFVYKVLPEKNGVRAIGRTPVKLTFDLSAGKMPIWATDVYLQVVYKGKMGSEDNAVAVGFKDISEPTPFDFINLPSTCYNGTWLASGSDDAIKTVDLDHDGIADFDIYKHVYKDMYVKISSPGTPQDKQTATVDNYTYKVDSIPSGQYHRAYYLTDEDFVFHARLTWTPIDSRDTFPEFSDTIRSYPVFESVTNQDIWESTQTCCEINGAPPCSKDHSNPECCERLFPNGCSVRHYPELEKFMGVYRWAKLRGYRRFIFPGYSDCSFDNYIPPTP